MLTFRQLKGKGGIPIFTIEVVRVLLTHSPMHPFSLFALPVNKLRNIQIANVILIHSRPSFRFAENLPRKPRQNVNNCTSRGPPCARSFDAWRTTHERAQPMWLSRTLFRSLSVKHRRQAAVMTFSLPCGFSFDKRNRRREKMWKMLSMAASSTQPYWMPHRLRQGNSNKWKFRSDFPMSGWHTVGAVSPATDEFCRLLVEHMDLRARHALIAVGHGNKKERIQIAGKG